MVVKAHIILVQHDLLESYKARKIRPKVSSDPGKTARQFFTSGQKLKSDGGDCHEFDMSVRAETTT